MDAGGAVGVKGSNGVEEVGKMGSEAMQASGWVLKLDPRLGFDPLVPEGVLN